MSVEGGLNSMLSSHSQSLSRALNGEEYRTRGFQHKLQSRGRVSCQESTDLREPDNLIIRRNFYGGFIELHCEQ